MKKLLLPLVAAAALAVPASAFAWGGGHTQAVGTSFMGGMKLSGTGTSFGSASASVAGSNFHGTLATTWSSAASNKLMLTNLTCAPATASITLNNSTTSYSGKTCSLARDGSTKYVFYGKASTGGHAFLGESGTTVKGAIFSRAALPLKMAMLVHASMNIAGHCDHH